MYISVDESQMSVFFLDCFRFCMNDTEYNVILNKRDLDVYEQEGYIDFSKINSGNIELTNWRYFNGENLSTIQLGLDCYVEEGKGIEEVVLEFCDNQGIAAAYHINNISEKMKKAAALF